MINNIVTADVRPLVFVRDDDTGQLSVQRWLDAMLISPHFLVDAPEVDTIITVRTDSEERKYHVVGITPSGDIVAELIVEEP